MQISSIFLGTALLLSLVLLIYFLLRRKTADTGSLMLQQRIDNLNSQLLNQLNTITQQVNERLKESAEITQMSNKTVGERLDRAAMVVNDVNKRLGQLDEANKHIYEVGKDIASLQEILRAPKLRGGLGELFLGDLLAQILPPQHFSLQYQFKNGERVDAAILLRDNKIVPVDSKFPLENFKKMLEAKNETEKLAANKQFINDIKKHIDKIAELYILPDEGTFDFALMYIPAENVYYESIVRGEGEHNLMHYAYDKKVIPVSPNTFYVYLQSILLGLRGLQIERGAKEILQNLSRLRVDFSKFYKDFELVGTHLSHARNSYEESTKRLGRFEEKLINAASKDGEPPVSLSPLGDSKIDGEQ